MGELSILDELYREGEFKSGHSERADEAMANVMGTLEGDHFTFDGFWKAWQELLGILPEENVSPHNLAMLSTPLVSRGLVGEDLTVLIFLETIAPPSDEVQAMLGMAHQRVGDLELAALHFRKAYDVAIQRANEKEFEPSHPLRLDASDYLRYLAEVEVKRNHGPQALAAALQALQIVEKAGVKFKDADVCDTLYRICLMMRLDTLAEAYRLRAEEARAGKR